MRSSNLLVLIALAAGSVAYAQGGPHGPGPGRGFGPGEFGMRPGKVVTGAPYSADVANTMVQTLADGNTIQHTTSGHVARDAEGRTYSLETISGRGFLGQNAPSNIVFISDPVAGYTYVLNPNTKVAMRRAIKAPPDWAGKGPHTRPASPDVVSSDLGTQVVNGVNAQGKSVTHTVPAGAMGNAAPIVSTSETWYSPDLQVVVSSKHNDPRSGQSTYALTNIQRAAPSETLFQVPSDYTVKDAPAGRGPGGRHGGPPPPPPPQ
jgi:hypothetical protein